MDGGQVVCWAPASDRQARLKEAGEEALQGAAEARGALGILLSYVAFPIPRCLTQHPRVCHSNSVH